MPATLREEPLGIACVFSNGTRAEFSLCGLPEPELARDLLVGLIELIHPHGSLDSTGSLVHFAGAIRAMVRTLSKQGFSGGAGQLDPRQLTQYWMDASVGREACTRRMLQGFDLSTGGLSAQARELAAGRAYNPQPFRRPLPPYSEMEWASLTETCRSIIDASFTAHRNALVDAEGGEDPASGGWTQKNLRWLGAHRGPLATAELSAHIGRSTLTTEMRRVSYLVTTELFPSLDVVIAYRLAFGIYSGIVPDGIDDLVIGDIDWAGDTTVLLSYLKGRTDPESLVLPRQAMRLLEQWLEHSALLRSFAAPTMRDALWLSVGRSGTGAIVDRAYRGALRRWVARYGITGPEGRPMKVHRARIRTTHHSMRAKPTWTGNPRATVDPNHSAAIEGDHYLTASTPAQIHAVQTIVEEAQHDMLRRADPPIVLCDEDAAILARDYPALVAGLGLDDAAIAELIGGAKDVFVAACSDQLSGLHGQKGKPCPARPWVCLLCPLAVFAPRHATNLLALKAFFSRQWRQMPSGQFMAVFGPYSQRIGEVLDHFDTTILAEAATGVGDRDDELPLRPEERTS